uniref:glutenin, high molecular weight subunit PW212-like n=1 Tax=Erigeron canadensis TaxID=72917 RepID=UPI001CB8B6D2|nr:glutenin, high molecular weight subunit PW212-like [Erigeron canadensis]
MDSYDPNLSGQPDPPQPINPSPPTTTTTTQSHPPYSEMIVAAIVGLKDKDGSSRQAIAKFIEKQYGPANLPPTHSNLLTHHLKRMKAEGQLVMNKHSYMLSGSRSQPELPLQPPGFGDYEVNNNNTDMYAAAGGFKPSDVVSPRRKPGRPAKPRHQDFGFQGEMPADLQQQQQPEEIQPYQPQFEQQLQFGNMQDFQSQGQYDAGGSGPGQETFQGNYAGGGNDNGGAEPIFASLGLADEGVPPTAPPPPPPPPENTVVSAKRGRGRPPKNASRGRKPGVAGSGGDVVEPARRKPGRPKMLSVSMVNGGGVKRAGRPKRVGGPLTGPLPGNVNKPSERPKRVVSKPEFYVSASGSDAQTRPVSRGNGRGRPANTKFRKLSSQSFGRPSKVGQGTAVLVTDPLQLVVYQELKLKYERLQSKAKEAVGVIRPHINPEYEAFGALKELETLVGGPL